MSIKTMMSSDKCDKCSSPVVYVDYGYHLDRRYEYDGWAHIECTECGYKLGRWSGKELEFAELEDVTLRFKGKY